jgi:endonuclease VIII
VARGRLREGPTVCQKERHTLLAASRVVPVDEVAERIQGGVLGERHPERDTPRTDRNPAADGVEGQAERRAVQGVQGEPRSTPVPAARHSFAEHGDVRVVATENPLIDRLEQCPNRRRGRARRRGPEALLRRHPGSLTRVPEGDSLARAARRLQVLVGERVEVVTPHPRAAVKRLAERLDGRRLLGVEAAGKNLVLRFEDGVVLRSHLRMSGRWQVRARGSKLFGRPWLVLRGAEREAVLWNGPVLELDDRAVRRLGPDILAQPPELDAMIANFRREPRRAVGDALLDQGLVAGIGNAWKAEALWEARVSPWRAVADTSDEELRAILQAAHEQMTASVETGRERRVVYNRAGRGCRRCGTPIEARGQGDDNRTAYWCPRCQAGEGPKTA